jgi:hypothetical protein
MTVLNMYDYNENRRLHQELREWQKRLQLAYEFDWKDPSKAICHSEIKRLKEILGEETILEKIQKMGM